ncbi:MAG: hypothetical protein AAF517_07700 [Planctomycetota bacterium]
MSNTAKRNVSFRRTVLAIGFACLSFAPTSLLSAAPKRLLEVIPSDTLAFFHWGSSEENGFFDSRLAAVRDSLRDSGFVDEFTRLLAQERKKGKERDSFVSESKYWTKILDDVPWWDLLRSEGAATLRVGLAGNLEFAFLFDVGDANFKKTLLSLRTVLRSLSGALGDYEMIEADRNSVPTTVVIGTATAEEICLGGGDGVVVLATSSALLRQTLELISGTGSSRPVVRNENYQKSQIELDARGAKASADATGRFELYYRPGEAFRRIEVLNVLSGFHWRAHTTATSADWSSKLALSKTKPNRLASSFETQKDAASLMPHVPPGSTAFHMKSGADAERFYEYSLDLLAIVTGGPFLGDLIQSSLSNSGFDLREEFLAFLTGRRGSLRFGDARAWVFETESNDAARNGIKRGLGRLRGIFSKLGAKSSGADIGPIDAGDEVFQINFQALFGWTLAIGVTGGKLVITTSVDALKRALKWSDDEKPSAAVSSVAPLLKLNEGEVLDAIAAGPLRNDIVDFTDSMRVIGALALLIPSESEGGFFKPFLASLPRLVPAVEKLSFLGDCRSSSVRVRGDYFGSVEIELSDRRAVAPGKQILVAERREGICQPADVAPQNGHLRLAQRAFE